MSLVLALVAIERFTETDWYALEHRYWFPYSYNERRNLVLPVGLPLVRRSASGTGLGEEGKLETGKGIE